MFFLGTQLKNAQLLGWNLVNLVQFRSTVICCKVSEWLWFKSLMNCGGLKRVKGLVFASVLRLQVVYYPLVNVYQEIWILKLYGNNMGKTTMIYKLPYFLEIII